MWLNPSSSRQGWFAGFFGPSPRFGPPVRQGLLFLLRIALAYALLSILLSPFPQAYWRLLTAVCEWVYNLLHHAHPVILGQEEYVILVRPGSEGWAVRAQVPAISASLITSNVLLTLSLILATPGIGFTRRAKLVGFGALLLVLTHILNVLVEIKMHYITFFAAELNVHYSPVEVRLVRWLFSSFHFLRGQLVPFLIWALLCFKHVFPVVTAGAIAGIPRNRPCPCGSGLKYKHCCGRTEREGKGGVDGSEGT